MRLVIGVLALLLITLPLAHGGVIYNEAVDGDFSVTGSFMQLPILNLEPGENLILGTTTAGLFPDSDSFAFLVPGGSVVNSVAIDLVDLQGDMARVGWKLVQGTSITNTGTILEIIDVQSPGSRASTFTPLMPDVYQLRHTLFARPPLGTHSSAYTITIDLAVTQPVPEPTSLAIFGTMGLLLTGSRRRRVVC